MSIKEFLLEPKIKQSFYRLKFLLIYITKENSLWSALVGADVGVAAAAMVDSSLTRFCAVGNADTGDTSIV